MQLDHKSKLDWARWEKLMYFNLKNDELSFPCAFLSIDKRRTKSQVYTLMLGSRNISVYCFMGDFGCGSGGWTLVMKTDGTKVKEGKFAGQFLFSFQNMVTLYFFVNFSKVLEMYFLVFAFPPWKIVISTKMIWFSDVAHSSLERYNFIQKKKKGEVFNTWLSFTEHLPLLLSFLEQQAGLQSCRREDWFWQTRNQIALLLGDALLEDLSWNEGRLNNKIRGHSPKCQLIVRTYRWQCIPKCFAGPWQVEVSYWSTSLTTDGLQ